MKNCSILCCLFFAFIFTPLITSAQGAKLTVSLHYEQASIQEILNDISSNFNINFSYSSDQIDADRIVNLHVDHQPLKVVLADFFAAEGILYAKIGDHIVLKPDPKRNKINKSSTSMSLPRALQPEEKPKAPKELLEEVIGGMDLELQQKEKAKSSKPKRTLKSINIAPKAVDKISHSSPDYKPELIPVSEEKTLIEKDSSAGNGFFKGLGDKKYRIAQVSIFPTLGTNMEDVGKTNILSLNLFWGVNGALDGLELGLMANSLKRDMRGLQAAGLFNTVGGQVKGVQLAGLCNMSAGDLVGMQAAGLWNTAKDVKGMQAAGLMNLSTAELKGFQAAGLGNLAYNGQAGTQAAGGFNINKGITHTQMAGAFNLADSVKGTQIAGGFNIANALKGTQVAGGINFAKEVSGSQIAVLNSCAKLKGTQFGIINFVDSLNNGATIGLLNIVLKNGYNRFGLEGSDLLHLNTSLRLGSKGFYNIFEAGMQLNLNSWGIGYGIGGYLPINAHYGLNIETVGTHLNENQLWGNDLNLLAQGRLSLEMKLAKNAYLHIGPTFNLMVSQIQNSDGSIGSQLPLYHFYNESFNQTNLKMWVGFRAGFRL